MIIPCLLTSTNLPKLPLPTLYPSLLLSNLFPSSSSMELLRKQTSPNTSSVAPIQLDYEEEDSFFELEFTLPPSEDDDLCKTGRIGDFISCENQDPRTIRSKLRVFIFGKKKARVDNFTVKVKFGRSDSSKRSSIRFSRDSVHKYLKPLYVKLSASKSCDSANTASFSSPRKSEERARFSAPVKRLGKSRSAGALLVGVGSFKDDSVAQQNDWIQGAILHCKESFNSSSSKGRRGMSRCTSDTSNDKSFQRSE